MGINHFLGAVLSIKTDDSPPKMKKILKNIKKILGGFPRFMGGNQLFLGAIPFMPTDAIFRLIFKRLSTVENVQVLIDMIVIFRAYGVPVPVPYRTVPHTIPYPVPSYHTRYRTP